jgi:hypothetical protein
MFIIMKAPISHSEGLSRRPNLPRDAICPSFIGLVQSKKARNLPTILLSVGNYIQLDDRG